MTVLASPYSLRSLHEAWDVFLLFLIPVGGGIPAGVILARDKAIAWPMMMLLYFLSDVVLACCFEPVMLGIRWIGKRILPFGRFLDAFKLALDKSIIRYGVNPGPITLIMVSFGVDPMTGRAAAMAAGHHFVMGWTFAIAGDMIFFTILMMSTLWLDGYLGDGTMTSIIILAAMFGIPWLFRRARKAYRENKNGPEGPQVL